MGDVRFEPATSVVYLGSSGGFTAVVGIGVTAFLKLVEVIIDGEPRDLQSVRSRLDAVFEQKEAATAQFVDYAELVIFTHCLLYTSDAADE